MSINQRLLASGDLSYFEQVFVNEGIDINGNVVGSNTPLGFACFLENERSVKWLLEHGANPSILPANGVPPLQVAAARGLVSIVKMLLNAGADVSQTSIPEHQTALHAAVEHNGQGDMLEMLIEAGVPLTTVDHTGFNALHFAAWKNRLECILVLRKHGADIESRNSADATPLQNAVWHGCYEAAMLLISLGAHKQPASKHGLSPLDFAYQKRDTKMIGLLLDAGCTPFKFTNPVPIDDNNAMTSMADIMKGLRSGRVRSILPYRKETNSEFVESTTHAPDVDTLQKVLLASEPEMGLETVDETGENLMHGAIEQENLDIAQFLIDAGCDFDGDGDLRSPLMDSVQYGKEAMVRLLIRNDADVMMRDYENWTAFGIARHAVLHSDPDKAQRIAQYVKHGPP